MQEVKSKFNPELQLELEVEQAEICKDIRI